MRAFRLAGGACPLVRTPPAIARRLQPDGPPLRGRSLLAQAPAQQLALRPGGGRGDDGHDHVWIVQRPRQLTDDEKGATLNPPRDACCVPAPAVMRVRQRGQPAAGLGRAGHRLRLAGERARHLRRSGRQRLARRQRREGPPDLKFTATAGSCCRSASRPERRQQRHANLLGAGRHAGRRRRQRAVRRRRLRQPPRHRLRRRHRRLQAPLGRLRQRPDDAKTAYDPAAPPSKQFGNPVHCVRGPPTGSSTSATG